MNSWKPLIALYNGTNPPLFSSSLVIQFISPHRIQSSPKHCLYSRKTSHWAFLTSMFELKYTLTNLQPISFYCALTWMSINQEHALLTSNVLLPSQNMARPPTRPARSTHGDPSIPIARLTTSIWVTPFFVSDKKNRVGEWSHKNSFNWWNVRGLPTPWTFQHMNYIDNLGTTYGWLPPPYELHEPQGKK